MGYAPLEIHHINVSQGESTLIIMRNVDQLATNIGAKGYTLPKEALEYLPFSVRKNQDPNTAANKKIKLEGTVLAAVLIDGGEDFFGGDVFDYLELHGVSGKATRATFTMVGTHYHSDHVDGLRSVYWKKNAGKPGKLQERYLPSVIYHCGKDPKQDPNSATFNLFTRELEKLQSRGELDFKVADPGRTKITLGLDKNGYEVTLTCIASNGVVDTGKKRVTIPNDPKSPDQNPRSVTFVLEYADFRYLLAGDLGGTGTEAGGNSGQNKDQRENPGEKKKPSYSSHPNVESTLRDALFNRYPKDRKRSGTVDGHICVFEADHHGSASSNDAYLLAFMKPCLVTISSGIKVKFHRHPTQEFFYRINPSKNYSPNWPLPSSKNTVVNGIKGYYITEMAVDGNHGSAGKTQRYTRTYPGGRIVGDIVVRPVDVTEAAPGKANPIKIQVYGSGIQTGIEPGDIRIRPVDGTKAAPYPVGPWSHTCDKH